jgi:purine-nucleoside phosphorylase
VTDQPNPYELARAAAEHLATLVGVARHDVAVWLGSGWKDAADAFGDGVELALTDLPGFPAPTALGHGGTVRSVAVDGLRVLVFLGRVHLYEGHPPAVVVHGVRTAAAAGCGVAVLTNGAGSLRADWPVGQGVVLTDHLNLTACSPLTGPPPPPGHAGRFVDLTDAYSPRLRALAREVDPSLVEGVYVGLGGPHFETPAEIRAFRVLGGDLVGMSTVLETIAARHSGMEVLGLSLATNPAAGVGAEPVDAEDVIRAGRAAAPRLGAVLRELCARLAAARPGPPEV